MNLYRVVFMNGVKDLRQSHVMCLCLTRAKLNAAQWTCGAVVQEYQNSYNTNETVCVCGRGGYTNAQISMCVHDDCCRTGSELIASQELFFFYTTSHKGDI